MESKSLFFDFVFNQTAAGTVARVWHEFLMAKCKNGVVEAAAWLALQGSTSQLDLSSFMSYDANADTSATAIKPGLNLTSAECFGMEIGSWLDLVTTKAGSFYAVDVETGLEQGSLLLAMVREIALVCLEHWCRLCVGEIRLTRATMTFRSRRSPFSKCWTSS